MKEGWDIKKLGEVCFITMGQSPNSESYNKLGDGLPFFQGCSDFGAIHPLVTTWCNQPNKIANPNDILMSVRAPIGTLNIADSKCCIGRGLAAFTQKEGVTINKFLYYFLLSSKGDLQSKGTGATFKAIGKELIKNYAIKLPSLSEQQHIVEELDLLSSIIEKKKAQLKELDNLAQSLFYEMFGDNADCSTKKIKDIAIVKIGPFGSSLHKSDYVSGGTPLINPIHMSEGKILPDENFTITNEKKKELETYLLQTNDIIFGRRGDIGRCALVTRKENGYLCGTGSLFVRFQVNINPIYCINYLSTRFVKDYLVQNAKGATMLNLNSKIIENVPMLFPSLDLQNQFASKIEAIERQKELIKQSIKEVETLFNSRMDYYFN